MENLLIYYLMKYSQLEKKKMIKTIIQENHEPSCPLYSPDEHFYLICRCAKIKEEKNTPPKKG